MNYGMQNWAWLSPLGTVMVIIGVVLTLLSAWISHRFFYQNQVINFVFKVVGVVLCLVGMMLALEIYR